MENDISNIYFTDSDDSGFDFEPINLNSADISELTIYESEAPVNLVYNDRK